MAAYRVGVIGCRGIGIEHASGLVGLTHVTLAAACDLDETTLAAFGDRWRSEWPDLNLYTDHREMLVRVVDEGGRPVSPAKDAHRVVEIMIGFLESQRLGNVRVDLPIPLERRGKQHA